MAPKRPHTDSDDARQSLDFQTWKAKRTGAQSKDGVAESVYNLSCEELPDKLWYTLDHRDIETKVDTMCQKLLTSVHKYATVDQEISNLIMALDSAKATPTPTKINIAVVGDQGIGKSSLINAPLHRDLVDVSASSSACTAFATIIQHKKNAKDDTRSSDIEVEFLKRDEIREFVEEQIRRYADAYGPQDPDDHMDDDEDAMDIFSDEESTAPAASSTDGKRKIPDSVQRGADTAKDFFHIIFGTQDDADALQDLQDWLQRSDLEDGCFLEHCVDIAMKHLAKIHEQEETLTYTDISDQDLQKHREFAATIWPLVRSVTISTGSILLRNDICFLDLPGQSIKVEIHRSAADNHRIW